MFQLPLCQTTTSQRQEVRTKILTDLQVNFTKRLTFKRLRAGHDEKSPESQAESDMNDVIELNAKLESDPNLLKQW